MTLINIYSEDCILILPSVKKMPTNITFKIALMLERYVCQRLDFGLELFGLVAVAVPLRAVLGLSDAAAAFPPPLALMTSEGSSFG